MSKNSLSILLFLLSFCTATFAQNGNVGIGNSNPAEKLHVAGNMKGNMLMLDGNRFNVLSYNYNGTPTHGYKIVTNLPFADGSQMPTIFIDGYSYGTQQPIGLKLVYYIFGGNFIYQRISSSGAYTPEVQLSNENGKVVIFINDKQYYLRFAVSAYANGMGEQDAYFKGWTVVDAPLSGTNTVTVPYENRFAGNVFMPGNGIWNSTGVGINTTSPTQTLDVNGNIRIRGGAGTVGRVLRSVSTDGTAGWGVMDWTDMTGVPSTFPPSAGSGNYIQNQYASDQSANFRISGNGAIMTALGIGTASPVEALGVYRAMSGWQGRFANQSAAGGADVYLSHGASYGMHIRGWNNSDGIYTLEMYNAAGLTNGFYNSGRTALGLQGNVGVGTSTPGNKLHVHGGWSSWPLRSENHYGYIDFGPANGGGAHIYTNTPQFYFNQTITLVGNPSRINAYDVHNLELQTNGATRLTILNANGNVGIGTGSPAHRLDVSGSIRSVGGTIYSELSSPEGGNLALVNPSKTGATTRDWRIWNMTGGYGNGLAFWRYYADGTNAGPSVWFGDNGLVGIGTQSPSYTLHVNGRIRSNGINETSDERLKKNIETLKDALQMVLQMRGVKYMWKEEAGEDRFSEGVQVGLIAQEVEKVLPEVVDTDKEGYKSIQYSVLVALLIEAMKEMKNEVNEVKAARDVTEARMNHLESQMESLMELVKARSSK